VFYCTIYLSNSPPHTHVLGYLNIGVVDGERGVRYRSPFPLFCMPPAVSKGLFFFFVKKSSIIIMDILNWAAWGQLWLTGKASLLCSIIYIADDLLLTLKSIKDKNLQNYTVKL
jgi:hypothetical protein